MPGQDLEQIIDALHGQPVLVVGDIMLDRFIYGHVDRISPESPVPVLSIAREDTMLGGAGNALANMAGLGAHAKILSIVGDDAEGRLIRQKAQQIGIDVNGLMIDAGRPTIVKTRYLAGHQQLLRTDFEKKIPLSKTLSDTLLQNAHRLMPDVKCLLISDYGKGLLGPDLLAALIKAARSHALPVIVDPKGFDFTIYKGATIITPNRKELSDATNGAPANTDDEIVKSAKKIMQECGINSVIATRSKDGISVIRPQQEPVHIRTADIEVFDVSGAGDAVIATIAAALAAGVDLVAAARLANLAGSIVVTKIGTAAIRASELREACHDENAFAYAGQKAPRAEKAEAAETVARWRAKNLKIGFTNGCFDILHAGHVTYLNAARGQCDRLIVGLNRDSSVRLLKGDGRPVHEEEARAAVLAALACVDMVVLFGAEKAGDDNTAGDLLQSLRPDIYFKGGDYTADQIPEKPVIEQYGGELVIIPAVAGQSTTGSLARLKKKPLKRSPLKDAMRDRR